jgi:hypothetical protein
MLMMLRGADESGRPKDLGLLQIKNFGDLWWIHRPTARVGAIRDRWDQCAQRPRVARNRGKPDAAGAAAASGGRGCRPDGQAELGKRHRTFTVRAFNGRADMLSIHRAHLASQEVAVLLGLDKATAEGFNVQGDRHPRGPDDGRSLRMSAH